jgi:hypothetical protein
MASVVVWLVGLLFLGIGVWILALRFEGVVDAFSPHTMSIGQITVDGADSKAYAELLRARFDHHFRRPIAVPSETGFLEAASLDTPELFQQKELPGALENVNVEVSGVDVAKFLRVVNQAVRPGQWTLEGDFQVQPTRTLLALRLSRGPRVIRTWYLERQGPAAERASFIEQLVDDAIFQLVYDFGNPADDNPDLRKWRGVVPVPEGFPSPSAVAAYYEARGALGRYYAHGGPSDLDLAVDRLRRLRAEMPKYADGLLLLGMALAEKRNEDEAIHVYEQLRILLLQDTPAWTRLPHDRIRRLLSVDLLKATATIKVNRWQSTHAAIRDLRQLEQALGQVPRDGQSSEDATAYRELRAQAAVELAYAYAAYLSFIRDYQVAEIFGSPDAPPELRITDPAQLSVLNEGPAPAAKALVLKAVRDAAAQHEHWMAEARAEQQRLAGEWTNLDDPRRREAELRSRLSLTAGAANYAMAEWERPEVTEPGELTFGRPFADRLDLATTQLNDADAFHPNHYLVLQTLGLAYAEPRRPASARSIGEQYFERAILASPGDYLGHELLAGLLLRRAIDGGIDVTSRTILERGLKQADLAVGLREVSGSAHLLRGQFQTLLLEIERDESRRTELRAGLDHSIEQASRFLPRVFQQEDVDLTWLRLVTAVRRLPTAAPGRFNEQRSALIAAAAALVAHCELLETRWVNSQRVFHVSKVKSSAVRLGTDMAAATLNSWRDIPIAFP